LPPRLRRLLHRALHQLRHPRHAARQTGRRACVQLDDTNACRIFGQPERPAVCGQLMPSAEMCGANAAAALAWLTRLERATAPPTIR